MLIRILRILTGCHRKQHLHRAGPTTGPSRRCILLSEAVFEFCQYSLDIARWDDAWKFAPYINLSYLRCAARK